MADRYGLETIATGLEGGVLTATLNRPDRGNGLNKQMHLDLRDLYRRHRRGR